MDDIDLKYTEIQRLHEMLTAAGIEHEFRKVTGKGFLIGYEWSAKCNKYRRSAVEHDFSLGNSINRIEVWGIGMKDAIGYLTAEQAFEFFKDMKGDKK